MASNSQQPAPKPLVCDEARKLIQQVIGQKSTILGCTVARIYTAGSESKWIFSNLQGILCLIWDREYESTPFLRMFDTESFDLLFEMEMYVDFGKSYSQLMPLFYFFEIFGSFIGIEFASQSEAAAFSLKVYTNALKSEDFEEQPDSLSASSAKTATAEKQSKGIFSGIKNSTGKLLGWWKKDKQERKFRVDEEISKPMSFTHDTSLQFDLKTNRFDFSKLNPEWQSIFLKAGIMPADLDNQELAPIIFDSVCKFLQNGTKPNNIEKVTTDARKVSSNTSALIPQNTIPPAPVLLLPPPAPVFKAPDLKPLAATLTTSKATELPAAAPEKQDLLAQIRLGNFALKKVDVNQKANIAIPTMDNKTQDNLSNYLSQCIAERRKQIRKNHYSSSENSCSSDEY